MKKNYMKIAVITVCAAGMMTASCGGTKQVAATQPSAVEKMKEEAALIKAQQELEDAKAEANRAAKQREADAALADANAKAQAARNASATEQPCQLYDDAEWFTATGLRRVKVNNLNTAPTALLRATQQQLRLKVKGTYKAVVRDYMDQMDADEGSYAVSHIESAGDFIIDQKVNETYEDCRKNTEPDEQGYVTLYMAIKVSKKAIVDEVVSTLSKDKQMETRFNEKQFRDSAFKVFEKSQKEDQQKFQESQGQ
jgi:Flp pilus assembly protein TadG